MRLRAIYFAFAFAVLATVWGASAEGPPLVERAELRSGPVGQAELAIEGEFRHPPYEVTDAEDGRRFRVRLRGARLPERGIRVEGTSPLVSSTTAAGSGDAVVFEVAVRHRSTYRARLRSGVLTVIFERLPESGGAKPASGSSSPAAPPSEKPTTARPSSAEVAPAEHGTSSTVSARITKVVLERHGVRERVVVHLDRAVPFRVVSEAGSAERLEIRDVTLGANVARHLKGEAGGLVSEVRVGVTQGAARIEADAFEGVRQTAVAEGKRIVWLFSRDGAQLATSSSRTIARERGFEEVAVEGQEAAGFLSGVPMQVGGARRDRRFGGRRIDIDFKDADIHNILRLLSDVGGVNIVTSDEVTGTVTIRMRNVPWDQALDVVLQAKGLGMERRGNLIRVAPLTALEKEREAAIARQKQQEQLAPLETRLIPVSYATAEDLQPRVRELLSSRGSVSVDERTNVLIVRDIRENQDDVEKLVRSLDTQTPQVLVEARIVEATSQYVRDVGIQWGGASVMSTATGNPTGLTFPANVAVAGGNYDANTPTQGLDPFQAAVATPNFAVNLPAITGTRQGGALGLTLGSIGGNFNLSVRLSAAEATGIVRIISSPRILTLDNHQAHIAQGTLIPYSQVSAQGVQTAFQEAKLQLEVRPHVTSDGSVSMHVKVTRDEPDFTRTSSRGDPTILKREAETELLVADGNTAVIGGIFTRNTGRNVDQVPFFGDIPILGILFQRRQVRDERNELLIFLTPRIVNREQALR